MVAWWAAPTAYCWAVLKVYRWVELWVAPKVAWMAATSAVLKVVMLAAHSVALMAGPWDYNSAVQKEWQWAAQSVIQ